MTNFAKIKDQTNIKNNYQEFKKRKIANKKVKNDIKNATKYKIVAFLYCKFIFVDTL